MFFKKTITFFISVTLAIVSISAWSIIKSLEQKIRKEKLSKNLVISKAKEVHYNKINDKGKIVYSSLAKSLIRYLNNDVLLHKVNVFFFDKKKPLTQWDIASDYAKTTNRSGRICFYGSVVMKKRDFFLDIQVITEQILYDRACNKLNTNHLVTISVTDTENITTSTGLIWNPTQGILSLLDGVRSYYAFGK